MLINGWRIYFLKRLFGKQRGDLREEVLRLKAKPPPQTYRQHPQVKLYAAVMRAIKEIIPSDPLASKFALTGPLKNYRRVKKLGLPNRYRLFFKVFQAPEQKSIFILWLGYPRKQGDKNDCYTAFQKMVKRGDFPDSLDALLSESHQD